MARDAANGILHCEYTPSNAHTYTHAHSLSPIPTIVHKEKIIHRDIAARNVLLGPNYGMSLLALFRYEKVYV